MGAITFATMQTVYQCLPPLCGSIQKACFGLGWGASIESKSVEAGVAFGLRPAFGLAPPPWGFRFLIISGVVSDTCGFFTTFVGFLLRSRSARFSIVVGLIRTSNIFATQSESSFLSQYGTGHFTTGIRHRGDKLTDIRKEI